MATDNFARILALKAKGASETVTYSSLPDKPTINNVTINGDLSLEDLGIKEIWVGTYNEYLEVASTLADGTLVIITDDDTIDSVPTQNSTNLVTSGGVYAFVVNNTLPASTKYASDITISINASDNVVTIQLKDQDGNNLGTAKTIDLVGKRVNNVTGAEVFNHYAGANSASGEYSHSEGYVTRVYGDKAHGEGTVNTTYGVASHIEGNQNIIGGAQSYGGQLSATVTTHGETYSFTGQGKGDNSHVEGSNNNALGNSSHAEGTGNNSVGANSHGEGQSNSAYGTSSHVEGYNNYAGGNYSHVEGGGNLTSTTAFFAHAEGYNTLSTGQASHTEGQDTVAKGSASHAGGYNTIANQNFQTVIGKNNDNKATTLVEIGNGADGNNRSNIVEVYTDKININGDIKSNNQSIITQFATMPTTNLSSYEGRIVQYIGTTDANYTNGVFYKCIETPESDPITYEWIETAVLSMDSVPTSNSTRPVQSGGVYTALADKVDKVSGKGLSANDYTNEDKAKVGEIDDKYPKAWDVELTQAEYDALPDTKYVDGKNYYITDGDTDKPIIYGFHVDPEESDPSDAITYLMDAVGMEPAKMGSTTFNYGSWKNAFFMPKPCMLKYDGTVDYYLDPNDFSKKIDGTPSDIANVNYDGNAMMEFPKIWFKFEAGIAEGEGYFYVSNQKVDSSYKCWCNLDSDGNEIEHFYMAIYNGTMPNGLSDKMRSLSGLRLTPTLAGFAAYDNTKTYAVGALCKVGTTAYECITAVTTAEEFDNSKWQEITPNNNGNTSGTEEIACAAANDATAKSEWYIDTWCDRVLVTALLYLIGKSLDLQSTFGRGIDSGNQTAAEAYVTGAANDKGLFYGSTANGSTVIKVFGIENFWACKWHRTAGLLGNSNGGYSYKMTASIADGSTADGYNTNGNGYLTTTESRTSNGYVSKMGFGEYGLVPISTTNGSSAKYYCDYFYAGAGFALVGGNAHDGALCGFCVDLALGVAYRYWGIAAALSCKPLAQFVSIPVYIGENQLDSVEGVSDYVDKSSGKIVRMIGEYTFTGDESFNKYGNSDVFYTSNTIDPVGITTVNIITMRCNHPAFTAIENKDTRYWLNPEADDICCFLPGGRSQVFFRSTSNFATAAECKAYLKAQYDNGTPVKISYWLKTPVEEDPPVPLPQIPTIAGTTVIDYDGDPKPSQMYVKYKDKGAQ